MAKASPSGSENVWRGVSIAAAGEAVRREFGDQLWQPGDGSLYHAWVIMAGQADLELAGRRLLVGPGTVVLVIPGAKVRVRPLRVQSISVAVVSFHFERNGRSVRCDPHARRPQKDKAAALEVTLAGIGEVALIGTLPSPFLAIPHRLLSAHQRLTSPRAAWLELGAQIMRLLMSLIQPARGLEAGGGLPRSRATLTAEYLYSHVADPVTLAELSAHIGVGISTLCREFRQHYGTSPMRFLAEERLARARTLLESPDFRIGEIAKLCGFTSPQVFSRCFAEAHGMSPRAWRQRLHGSRG